MYRFNSFWYTSSTTYYLVFCTEDLIWNSCEILNLSCINVISRLVQWWFFLENWLDYCGASWWWLVPACQFLVACLERCISEISCSFSPLLNFVSRHCFGGVCNVLGKTLLLLCCIFLSSWWCRNQNIWMKTFYLLYAFYNGYHNRIVHLSALWSPT